MWHDRIVTCKDLVLDSLACELNQRGKLPGEKSRSVEVFRSVYRKFLEQGLLFWVCIVPCTMGMWSRLRHQSTTVMQIKFYSQYDSQLGVIAASSSFIGCKVVELLDHDHRTTKIRQPQETLREGKYRQIILSVVQIQCLCIRGVKWKWVMEPFVAESASNPSQTKQPLTFYQLMGVWQVLSNKLVGFNHVLVDWHMSALKILQPAHQDDGEKKFKKLK